MGLTDVLFCVLEQYTLSQFVQYWLAPKKTSKHDCFIWDVMHQLKQLAFLRLSAPVDLKYQQTGNTIHKWCSCFYVLFTSKRAPRHVLFKLLLIVSEYDQENSLSQTADKPEAPQGRATQQSRATWETN